MAGKHVQTAHEKFLEASGRKAFDRAHRKIISYNIGCYDEAVRGGKAQFVNLEAARRLAAEKKHHVLEHLEDHLKAFEREFTSRGGRVIWAQDAEEARKAILEIFEKHYVRQVVKSKSMVTEEIGLTRFLEKNGIDCLETDLGEYIIQITDDRPYHIVTPAMHLSAEDVAGVFHERFGLPAGSTPQEITAFVRNILREKFIKAHAAITGANFLVSGTGSVAITENEGNALMAVSFPKIHIAVAGIERVVSSLEDLDLFWPLLASHGTGQDITAYNTVINGPRRQGEAGGPEQMFVILLDNGRSRLLSAIPQRRSLSCIRCGACLNACPIYRNIGGHAYGTVYTGPIGAIISPHLSGNIRENIHLSHASSLCGKCTEVCPAGIDLHHQLLQNRHLSVRLGYPPRSERLGMKMVKKAMSNPGWLDKPPPAIKNFFARVLFGKAWGPGRVLPKVVNSFRRRYTKGER